jgi:hypothetical protein
MEHKNQRWSRVAAAAAAVRSNKVTVGETYVIVEGASRENTHATCAR